MWGVPADIADEVSKLKDAPSRYLPGHAHRGFNHGILTNVKYALAYGFQGFKASISHNIADRIAFARKTSRKLIALLTTFFYARVLTWYLGKMICNIIFPALMPPRYLKKRIGLINRTYSLIFG